MPTPSPTPPLGRILFFDVETDGLPFRGSRGGNDFHLVEVTVACALEVEAHEGGNEGLLRLSPSPRGKLYCWRDDDAVFEPLFAAMDEADVIVAYNGAGFDVPALQKYYSRKRGGAERQGRHRAKLFDPFSRIRDATGGWPKLDALLKANDICGKTSDGREAIRMWERGEREELGAYCMADVVKMAQLCCPNASAPLRLPDEKAPPPPRFQYDPSMAAFGKGGELWL